MAIDDPTPGRTPAPAPDIALARLPASLYAAIGVLVLLHVVTVTIHYTTFDIPWLFRSLFDLDEEQSFGTWFIALLLAFGGTLALVRRASLPRQGRDDVRWLVLGVGFFTLSADEVAGMHESLNTAVTVSWTIPLGLLTAVVGLWFVPFLLRLPRVLAIRFVIAGAVYLSGALGVELATEWYDENDLLDTLEYNLTTALEEGLEMLGAALFAAALIRNLADDGVRPRLIFGSRAAG